MSIPRPPRRKPSPRRKPPAVAGAAAAPPNPADGSELLLPHERDQRSGHTDPRPADVMRQAKADLDRGLVDTDLRATPGLDAQRRRELLKPGR